MKMKKVYGHELVKYYKCNLFHRVAPTKFEQWKTTYPKDARSGAN